jgi:predicted nucleic acid-binding protein
VTCAVSLTSRVERLCTRHARIGLDTNLFIYLFEGGEPEATVVGSMLDSISAGLSRGVLATLGVAELLTGPLRMSDGALAERYRDELQSIEGLDIVPLSVDIAADAAVLRASGKARLADAIHLATARVAGATAFVTNDRALRAPHGLEIVQLSVLVAA